MRKIVSLVLVAVLTAVTLWAEPVVKTVDLDGEKYTFISDTEYKAVNIGNRSDDELIKIMIDVFTPEINGKHYECLESAFTEVDVIAKEYPRYWLVSEDESLIVIYNSLSDGRMVALVFSAE